MNRVDLKELTQRLELTSRRSQQLAAAGIFVRSERGNYDLCQSAINYALFLRRHNGSEAEIPVTLLEISKCIGESLGNTRTLEKGSLFKRLSHGRYDLIESVRRYIQAHKIGWRGRGRPRLCSCGSPVLSLFDKTDKEDKQK